MATLSLVNSILLTNLLAFKSKLNEIYSIHYCNKKTNIPLINNKGSNIKQVLVKLNNQTAIVKWKLR